MGMLKIKASNGGGVYLNFPYGEWVIFGLVLLTWAEGRAAQRFFLMLAIAWLLGKSLEIGLPSLMPWHWHFARLAVMLLFGGWALWRSERRIFPLVFTSFLFSIETLFIVNEPGVFPYGAWLFTLALTLVAWLTAKSYWGTAAAFVGSVLLNQALVRFAYEGIVRHADLPDSFIWNFGVLFFTGWAGWRLGWKNFTARARRKSTSEQLLPVNAVGVCEQAEDRELQ